VLLPVFLFAQESDSAQTKNPLAIFPALSFAPETSLQFGAAAVLVLKQNSQQQSDYVRQSTVAPFFIYTLRNQIISAINLTYFTPKDDFIDGSIRFFNFPDLYFGIGNANDPDISESYTNTFIQIRGNYLKSLSRKSFFGISWDGQLNNIGEIEPAGVLATDNIEGIEGGVLFGVGPTYRFDTRDDTIYPTTGNFVTVSTLLTYLGDFSYTSGLIDARKYMPLWNEKNLLAFQFSTRFTLGEDVPFFKLPQLGGDERLRGIANASLYRDRQMAYAQMEYRRPLFWRFGMVVFAGAGDVASRFDEFKFSEFKYVFGMGGRFAAIVEDKLNLRVDLGVARGGQIAIYAGISEAF